MISLGAPFRLADALENRNGDLRGYSVLTENVGDFARTAAEHSTAGGHHPGVLIAVSSRFSRRPAGIGPLIAATQAIAGEQIGVRVVYLNKPERR